MATVAPYGSWESPVSAARVASGNRRRSGAVLAADGALWWAELRPEEGGRTALMRRPEGGETTEATPADANARTRVHEYGGGAWTVVAADVVVYAEFSDQRLYRRRLGEEAVAITPAPAAGEALHYADMRLAPDGETLVSVREIHPAGGGEPENQIVALPLSGEGDAQVLACGRDFYSFPRVSADGRTLAFTCWDHPNMPWDGTELWTAPLDGEGSARQVAGGPAESVFQPEWGPDGRLHYLSDRSGWWNLYAADASGGNEEQLTAEEADLGYPQWLFGGSTYAFLASGAIAFVRTERATERLCVRDPEGGPLRDLGLPCTDFVFPSIAARGDRVSFVAGSPEAEPTVVVCDLASGEREELAGAAEEEPLDPAYVPVPRPVEFETGDGEVAYGFYYPPTNPEFEAPAGEAPPLIVESHGGPTAHVVPHLKREFLFWTSRGFAVVDVNYRGSTGHGRAYREKLKGAWGVIDNEDCVQAARHLAASGDADAERLTIRGGSAGGYATLCALVFHDEFAAGASYFGVADAEGLAADTHKFESRYLDLLIGPYPERADLYRERSPINHVERLRSPAILFQGLEDEIVPPNQAETMVAAMKANGVPHAYLAFAGEQHGFRKAETNIRCLEAELCFYGRILGFEPAGEIEPVAIVGLDG